jgi:two-component system chemotaxis sensor kinase CheA
MAQSLDITPEDLKVFLEEAEEQLQLLEGDIVKLEKSEDAELLQEIFRAAHTLKGSSATLGHQPMAQLTHAMENVLDKLRKKKLAASMDVVNLLFECLDLLRAMKDDIADGHETVIDLGPVLTKLASDFGVPAAQTAGGGASGAPPEIAPGNPTEPAPAGRDAIEVAREFASGLNDTERAQLVSGMAQGVQAVHCRVAFIPDCLMTSVRAYQVLLALGEMGEVIKSFPSPEDIEAERVGHEIAALLLTLEEKAHVEGTLKAIGDVESAVVSVAQAAPGDVQPTREPTPAPESGRESQASKKGATTVRVDVNLLDNLMNLVGELVIDRTHLAQIMGRTEQGRGLAEASDDLVRTSAHIGRVTTQLQEEIMKARMLPIENLFKKFPRMVRDLALKARKEIDFVIEGQETELDRSVIEEIGDPLMHLLRNSVDHGLESPEERLAAGKPRTGTVRLAAEHSESHIIITVSDDGRGIDLDKVKASAVRKGLISEAAAKRLSDKEALDLIFVSGLSTAQAVTEVSGRGVGMDVVRKNIERLNGSIEVVTNLGLGTETRIKLPLTLAIVRALLVSLGSSVFAIPLTSVSETIRLTAQAIKTIRRKEAIVVRDSVLPLVRLAKVFGMPEAADRSSQYVVVVSSNGQRLGLVVDGLVGEQEVVIKSLGGFIGNITGLSGATILGEGDVALIIDVGSLVKSETNLRMGLVS